MFNRRVWWASRVLWFASPIVFAAGFIPIVVGFDEFTAGDPLKQPAIWVAGLGPTLIGTGFLLRQFIRTTWGVVGSTFARLRRLLLYVFVIGTATAINSFLVGYAIVVCWAIIVALSDPAGWNTD